MEGEAEEGRRREVCPTREKRGEKKGEEETRESRGEGERVGNREQRRRGIEDGRGSERTGVERRGKRIGGSGDKGKQGNRGDEYRRDERRAEASSMHVKSE